MQDRNLIEEMLGKDRPLIKKRRSINVRSYLWQIIRTSITHGSMASWGLPFEAIAASMLLRDRPKHPKHTKHRKPDSD